jgi:hypothetical protein
LVGIAVDLRIGAATPLAQARSETTRKAHRKRPPPA